MKNLYRIKIRNSISYNNVFYVVSTDPTTACNNLEQHLIKNSCLTALDRQWDNIELLATESSTATEVSNLVTGDY